MNKKRKADCDNLRGKVAAAEGQLREMVNERFNALLLISLIEGTKILID